MSAESSPPPRYSPLWQLTLARLREFSRQPAAIFWVYGFPLLITVALGIAFRNRPVEEISIDVVRENDFPEKVQAVVEKLQQDKRLKVSVEALDLARNRLQAGETDLILVADTKGKETTHQLYDTERPASVLARSVVENVLLRSQATSNTPQIESETVESRGARYIDFLIPGLIGMNLMGGGLWGVGFVTVDLRVRKLLKRFLATPMKRYQYLLSLMLSRLMFGVPEIILLIIFAYLVFGVTLQGNVLLLLGVVILGAMSFSGIGLLVASRARTLETVSGLMNLVMLPMYVCSGVFFSWKRFPEVMHPVIQALPLTALNDSLRDIMLEGKGIGALALNLGIVALWGGVSFVLALRLFQWK